MFCAAVHIELREHGRATRKDLGKVHLLPPETRMVVRRADSLRDFHKAKTQTEAVKQLDVGQVPVPLAET
ncbi:MAG: hypothetical protein JWM42_201 [Burkholderia sp.]|nr:hypothetical protein [Burkholderia sp.]